MNSHERLIYMANQIARNFGTLAPEVAADAVADHIVKFWDPRMKAMILSDGRGLNSVAAAAINSLKESAASA